MTVFWISAIAGIAATSWWVFLGCLFILLSLPDTRFVGLFSMVWSLTWTALISIPIGMSISIGAGVTAAVFVMAITLVPMRSSEQYWRDLEKNGGPWRD